MELKKFILIDSHRKKSKKIDCMHILVLKKSADQKLQAATLLTSYQPRSLYSFTLILHCFYFILKKNNRESLLGKSISIPKPFLDRKANHESFAMHAKAISEEKSNVKSADLVRA